LTGEVRLRLVHPPCDVPKSLEEEGHPPAVVGDRLPSCKNASFRADCIEYLSALTSLNRSVASHDSLVSFSRSSWEIEDDMLLVDAL
jgi:hypothetical protein